MTTNKELLAALRAVRQDVEQALDAARTAYQSAWAAYDAVPDGGDVGDARGMVADAERTVEACITSCERARWAEDRQMVRMETKQ